MAGRSIDGGPSYSNRLEQSPQSDIHNGVPSQGLKRKRNRIPVACFNCRALKTKCDGSKPVCSTCASNGDDCQYSSKGIAASSNVIMVNQQYLRSLEQRLARLEQGAPQDSIGDHQTSPYSNISALQVTPTHASISPSNSNFARPTSSPRNQEITMVYSKPLNALSNDNPLVVSADPDVFMGGVSFTQLILNAMNGRTIGLRTQSFCSNGDELFPPSAIFELPHEVRDLVRHFFEHNHTISPIFHEPTTRESFEDAINCPVLDRYHHRYTLAVMNMIFAVCLSHRLIDKDTNPAISRRYYDIAMELLKPTLLRDWRLEKVQALILGARYLQCSNAPDECWNVLGLAIRIAHGLELHRPPPDEDECHTKEIKKRVWYACFTLDKLLSMIYGRPAATSLSECSCPLPEDLDDDCIYKDRLLHPAPKRASSISFSIEVAKLYGILESATRSSDLEITNGESLAQSVLSLDEKYQKWYNELPLSLRLNDTDEDDKPLILALRANMVRILIHRPSLALTLRALSSSGNEKRPNEGVKSSILQHSRNICVSTAMETINLISRRHEQTQKKSGTSWFNLYYLFNAILILVSHVVDPAYHNDKPALSRLDKALGMIKAMSSNHTFAQKAYFFLQQLLSCIDKSLPTGQGRNWDIGIATPTGQRTGGGIGSSSIIDEGATDMFALFDFTQDLTETYTNIESEMEAWFGEQGEVFAGDR